MLSRSIHGPYKISREDHSIYLDKGLSFCAGAHQKQAATWLTPEQVEQMHDAYSPTSSRTTSRDPTKRSSHCCRTPVFA